MGLFLKNPQSRLDYQLDWGGRYPDRTILVQSSWSVTPAHVDGVRVDSSQYDLLTATVVLSGGEPGRVYDVTNHVTLDNGVVDEASITIRVEAQ